MREESSEAPSPAGLPGTHKRHTQRLGMAYFKGGWGPQLCFHCPTQGAARHRPGAFRKSAQMCVCRGEAGGVRAGDRGGEGSGAAGGGRGRMPCAFM